MRRASPLHCCLLILIAAPVALGVQLTDLDADCRKVLWLAGLQLLSAEGKQSQYITSSSTYADHYLVALRSAAEHAPSLQPVLVTQGHIDADFAANVRALGGQVVDHYLTFGDLLTEHMPDLDSGLRGSYLRIDVAQVMPKVLAAVAGDDAAAEVDTEYVLWTDPDVLFLGDIDSCSLPKPRVLSIGPDATKSNADNCGVIYFNVSGFAAVWEAMIEWGVQARFDFHTADQDLLNGFFYHSFQAAHVTQLPDTYNWKPYWGRPTTVGGWSPMPAIKIVHFHGPKLDLSLCVLEQLREREVAPADGPAYASDAVNEQPLADACGCSSKVVPCSALFGLIGSAYSADGGQFYADLKQAYDGYASHQLQQEQVVAQRVHTARHHGEHR